MRPGQYFSCTGCFGENLWLATHLALFLSYSVEAQIGPRIEKDVQLVSSFVLHVILVSVKLNARTGVLHSLEVITALRNTFRFSWKRDRILESEYPRYIFIPY